MEAVAQWRTRSCNGLVCLEECSMTDQDIALDLVFPSSPWSRGRRVLLVSDETR